MTGEIIDWITRRSHQLLSHCERCLCVGSKWSHLSSSALFLCYVLQVLLPKRLYLLIVKHHETQKPMWFIMCYMQMIIYIQKGAFFNISACFLAWFQVKHGLQSIRPQAYWWRGVTLLRWTAGTTNIAIGMTRTGFSSYQGRVWSWSSTRCLSSSLTLGTLARTNTQPARLWLRADLSQWNTWNQVTTECISVLLRRDTVMQIPVKLHQNYIRVRRGFITSFQRSWVTCACGFTMWWSWFMLCFPCLQHFCNQGK